MWIHRQKNSVHSWHCNVPTPSLLCEPPEKPKYNGEVSTGRPCHKAQITYQPMVTGVNSTRKEIPVWGCVEEEIFTQCRTDQVGYNMVVSWPRAQHLSHYTALLWSSMVCSTPLGLLRSMAVCSAPFCQHISSVSAQPGKHSLRWEGKCALRARGACMDRSPWSWPLIGLPSCKWEL